jgi:hypothetical protein
MRNSVPREDAVDREWSALAWSMRLPFLCGVLAVGNDPILIFPLNRTDFACVACAEVGGYRDTFPLPSLGS